MVMLCVACISYIILLLVHLGLSVHLPPPLLGPALEVVEVTTVEGKFSSQMYDAVAHGIEEVPVMGHDHQRRCSPTASTGYCSRPSTVFQFVLRRLKFSDVAVTQPLVPLSAVPW